MGHRRGHALGGVGREGAEPGPGPGRGRVPDSGERRKERLEGEGPAPGQGSCALQGLLVVLVAVARGLFEDPGDADLDVRVDAGKVHPRELVLVGRGPVLGGRRGERLGDDGVHGDAVERAPAEGGGVVEGAGGVGGGGWVREGSDGEESPVIALALAQEGGGGSGQTVEGAGEVLVGGRARDAAAEDTAARVRRFDVIERAWPHGVGLGIASSVAARKSADSLGNVETDWRVALHEIFIQRERFGGKVNSLQFSC